MNPSRERRSQHRVKTRVSTLGLEDAMKPAMRATLEMTLSVSGISDAAWEIIEATFVEQIDGLYELAIVCHTDSEVVPEQALGQRAHLSLIHGDVVRGIGGLVCEVEGRSERFETGMPVRFVVRPALEALRHRVDSRIFQGKTVPEILDEVLAPLGEYKSSVDKHLSRTYRPNDYRTQYCESDFDFACRLMEEEGIAFFFDLSSENEKLVLVDDASSYTAISGPIPYSIGRSSAELDVRGVHAFAVTSRVRPTQIKTRHFHWRTPATFVEADASDPSAFELRDGASIDPVRDEYDHEQLPLTIEPDAAQHAGDKADQIKIRREAQRRDARTARGQSDVFAMQAGATFELNGHPVADLDGEYLITAVTHTLAARGTQYSNHFECLPKSTAYRPLRRTHKPRMPSVQTGVVVGPAGEEIYTDEHARIKVQLPWDRLGKNDEKASCWMRVRQPWAGSGWGFLFVPRIGMEVVVDFLEGDPDRPIVLGCLYNGEHLVPYPLPDEKTKSTIKTESSIGGGGNNELRFEDRAGSEEIYIHAQKDFNEVVEHDHTTTVHNNQKIRVDVNQTQEIGANQTEHVKANVDMTVDANRTVAVHGNFKETIDGSHTRTVSSGVTETISAGETRTVSGGMTETISGGRTQTINGSSTETIVGTLNQSISGGVTITTPGALTLTAIGGVTINAAGGTKIKTNTYMLIAPGGHTHHDDFWKVYASKWLDNFCIKYDYTLSSFEYTALRLTMNRTDMVQYKGALATLYAVNLGNHFKEEEKHGAKVTAAAIDAESNTLTERK